MLFTLAFISAVGVVLSQRLRLQENVPAEVNQGRQLCLCCCAVEDTRLASARLRLEW